MKKTDKQSIAACHRLIKWREGLKISQRQAAQKLNVPLPTYRNWEQLVSRIPGTVWAFIEQTG